MKNVIIGGGISGILTAYRLIKRGEEVIVLEKENYLGGLMATEKISNTPIERFYHHIFRNDKKAIKLINELGLAKNFKWFDSSMSIYFQGKFHSFRKPIDLLRFEPIGFWDRIRTGVVTLYLQKNKKGIKLENIPAYKWIKKYGGRRAYEVIWKPLLVSKFGKHYKNVSMAWLWGRIYLRASSTEGKDEKLGYLKNSFGSILEKLTDKIKQKGGIIKVGVYVKKILPKRSSLEVWYDDKKVETDRVIVCTSGDVMAKMIVANDKGLNKKLRQIKYIGAINLIFSTKQSLVNYYWNNINDIESPFVVLVKHSQLVGKYNNRHIYYLGAYVDEEEELFLKSDKDIKKTFFDYLKKICPKFDSKKVEEIKVFRSNRAQQITGIGYQNKIVGIKTDIKNLYFINFSQIYPWDRGLNWAIDKVDELFKLL